MNRKTAVLDPEEWRPLQDFGTWDHADFLRNATTHDSPKLDVRVQFRAGRYWVDVRGPQ